MKRSVSLFGALLVLSACTTAWVQHPTQEITIETPGTGGALCILESEGYRKRVWAPKTVRVVKTENPLAVRCMAPGNREKTIIVRPYKPGHLPTAMVTEPVNTVLEAVADLKYSDIDSYPSKVIVDFTEMMPTHMPLPEYQHVLEQNPAIAGLEEFKPGAAPMLRDRYEYDVPLRPRETVTDSLFSSPLDAAMMPEGEFASEATSGGEGGGVESSPDSLTRSMNPAVFEPPYSGEYVGGTTATGSGSRSGLSRGGQQPLELIRQ